MGCPRAASAWLYGVGDQCACMSIETGLPTPPFPGRAAHHGIGVSAAWMAAAAAMPRKPRRAIPNSRFIVTLLLLRYLTASAGSPDTGLRLPSSEGGCDEKGLGAGRNCR